MFHIIFMLIKLFSERMPCERAYSHSHSESPWIFALICHQTVFSSTLFYFLVLQS